MGVVLKAWDPALRRLVAIKVLAPELAADPTARRRFQREARAVAAIDHDHVVAIYTARRAGRLSYLVMPYIRGPSLAAKIRAGPLGLDDILRIGRQTAAGLAAAHARGIIHRDLKPANILLEGNTERVKITDFGLARSAHDNPLTQPGAILGTPRFMAPEQARGQVVDHRADLFSLGSVLYAMGTGQAPFLATTLMGVLWQVISEAPPPIQGLNPTIPGWLAAVIERLHAKDPAGRFQSATEVAEVLGHPPGGLPRTGSGHAATC
jgi:serine/threonine protein kinase